MIFKHFAAALYQQHQNWVITIIVKILMVQQTQVIRHMLILDHVQRYYRTLQ